MSATFLDTSFLIAISMPSDHAHRAALSLRDVQQGPLLTTEHVLAEVLDALAAPHRRRKALQLVSAVRSRPNVTVIPASTDLFEQGLTLYTSRPDKDWGLTDCISFVVMQREGITHALTADKHFEQAGFTALLK